MLHEILHKSFLYYQLSSTSLTMLTYLRHYFILQPFFPGFSHGTGRVTISKSSNIHEHHRGHKKRYNSDLSPIYENIAYLDLEHQHRQTAAHHDGARNSTETEDGETLLQSSKDRGRHQHGAKRRHSDFPINTRCSGHNPLNHSHRQCRKRPNSTPETLQLEETNTSKRKTKEISRLKQQNSRSEDQSCRPIDHSCKSDSGDHKSTENDNKNEHMVADRNMFINNKRRLHHTHSDPTNDKTRSRPKKREYVGYNVIENFLRESNFDSDQMVQNLKTFRSNSEPLVHVPRRLKHALFIDAYEEKSKSLEDIISNTTDNVPVKLKGDVSNSNYITTHFKPIEAYKEDASNCTSNPQPLDDQVPTTSKGLTQSSLYQVLNIHSNTICIFLHYAFYNFPLFIWSDNDLHDLPCVCKRASMYVCV